jgi:ribosomal protein S18 acetylase RimI-like enzyme
MPQDNSFSPAPIDSDLRLRPARRTDANALARLETAAFRGDRLSRRSFAALVRSPSAILLVAIVSGAIVGYALVLTRRGSRVARLYSLAVAPEAGGQGLGSRLLAASERAARARGAESLRLEVRSDNSAAIGLYERRGYRLIGRRADYYHDGAAALRYQRRLPPSASRTTQTGERRAA